jgi:hypothetical protein
MRRIHPLLFLGLTFAPLFTDTAPGADGPGKRQVAIPMKVQRYAGTLIDQYDADGDGELSQTEWEQMGGAPKLADRDRDGRLTAAELADHIAKYGRRRRILLMPGPQEEFVGFPSLLRAEEKASRDRGDRLESDMTGQPGMPQNRLGDSAPTSKKKLTPRFTVSRSRMPEGLPSWFRTLDRNGDGQLTLAEFSPEGQPADVAEYGQYDLNRDGLLTPDEYIQSIKRPAARRPLDEWEPPREEMEPAETVEQVPAEDEQEMTEEQQAAPDATERKLISAEKRAELKKLKRTSRTVKQ